MKLHLALRLGVTVVLSSVSAEEIKGGQTLISPL
jgi:hypothetical protein